MVIAMDYKKKYKDLLERARKLRDKNCDGCKMCMESLFDELAESEDERIRKAIIETIKDCSAILSSDNQKRMIAWLEKLAQSIIIPKDLKGTDTDGGVVGEKGEQGKTPFNKKRLEEVAKPETLEEKVEHWQRMRDIAMEKIKGEFKEEDSPETKAIKEQIENLKKRIEDNQLGCIVQRLDKIIELLQSAILVLPKETYVPTTIYKNPLDPDPNTLGGWETTANIFGSDHDIDTNKIKQDETNKSKS